MLFCPNPSAKTPFTWGKKMSSDYAADIRKYTAKINDKAVAAIVKFCGIALRRAQRASITMMPRFNAW